MWDVVGDAFPFWVLSSLSFLQDGHSVLVIHFSFLEPLDPSRLLLQTQ
jgi:hypothetical protein